MLLLPVALAVVSQLPGLPIRQEEAYYPAKIKPSLSMKVRPKADATKPYRFTMSGTLQRNGVEQFPGCRGRVALRIRRGDTTVAKGRVKVNSECNYSKRLQLSTFKLTQKERAGGLLRVSARFGGNAVLQPDAPPLRKATFGTAARG